MDVDDLEPARSGVRRITEPDGGEAEPAEPLSSEEHVGRYVIQHFLAEGGMGVVYVAFDPELGRRVALKLVKTRGNPDGYLRERLLREAQALAQLSHPNVVTVHDVGIHDDRVFIAMELVEGVSLRSWLEKPRKWRAIVEVLAGAGRGLAAAHSAGIVHRDFKPDNVIVGNDGRVCVLDFGLARAVDGTATESGISAAPLLPTAPSPDSIATVTMPAASEVRSVGNSRERLEVHLTRLGTVVGTPAYMSPEHHRGEPVTAASDQFSFCVAAWESLYGRRPFSSSGGDSLRQVKERQRIIAPPRGRRVPARVRRLLLRGLAPDPSARHASMEQLLAELSRALYAPRRWAAAGAAAAAVLGISAAVLWRTTPARLCTTERSRARLASAWGGEVAAQIARAFAATQRAHAVDTAQRTRGALDRYGEAWTAMHLDSCAATHERHDQSAELLDLRTRCLDSRRDALRALTALFSTTVDGEVVDHAVEAVLGLPSVAECADAEALRAVVPLPGDPIVRDQIKAAQSKLQDVNARVATGQYPAAMPGALEVVAAARKLAYPPLLAEALHTQSSLEDDLGHFEQALTSAREGTVVAGAARDDTMMVQAIVDEMWALDQQARFAEALTLNTPAEAMIARAGKHKELRAGLLSVVGSLLSGQGKYTESVTILEEAVKLREAEVGPNHLRLASVINNLGEALRALGRNAEATKQYQRALQITEGALGPNHPNVGAVLNNLAAVLEEEHKFDEARAMYERSLAIDEEVFGKDHPRVAVSLLNYGELEMSLGRHAVAIPYFERALEIQRRAVGEKHPEVAMALHNLGAAYQGLGQLDRAEEMFRAALAAFEATLPPDHANLAPPLTGIGEVLVAKHRVSEGLGYYERALAIQEKALGPDALDLGYTYHGLGEGYLRANRTAAAVAMAEREVALYAKHSEDPAGAAGANFLLARALWAGNGDRKRAAGLARSARSALAAATTGDLDAVKKTLREVEAWLAERHLAAK
jgi:eukaryotic-like serine/threonine-protein kinase